MNDYFVSIVSYTGFDENDKNDFSTITNEVEQIEKYVKENYNNKILAAYGCSLGGSIVGLLVARKNIHLKFGILGSSDLDQSNIIMAKIKGKLMSKVLYSFIHNGSYKTNLFKKKYERQMASEDPYNHAFIDIVRLDDKGMPFISKKSIENQFVSDLITPLPENIDNGETEIHIFYAKKMGEKYLERYKKHFKNPIIHEQNMRHEEFLGCYPKDWANLVKQVTMINKQHK